MKETRKSRIEKIAKEFLCEEIIEKSGGLITKENAPDYIQEFVWVKTVLYASIDALRNPTPIASLTKGVYVYQ